MTQDERKMLEDLANKIAQTPAPPRDPEAEDFIRRQIGSRPDALYLMTQTVLIQNLALQHAQQQLQQLQQSQGSTPQVAGGGGSFLGQQQDTSRSAGYGSQYSAPPPPQYAPPSPAAPSPQVSTPGGAPSFLKGAAQTAAGVAAGAFAFEGIRSLFSHPGYGGGGGGFFGGGGIGGYAPQVDETVVNNYYDSPQDAGSDDRGFMDNGNDAGNNDLGPSDDTDYSDAGSGFDDSNYDDNSGGSDFS